MATSIKLLIVDDDPLTLEMLRMITECYGYKTTLASDGYGAMNAIQSKFYHIALIDIVMPDMNGVELMTEIRRIRIHTRIVMMTAHSQDHPLVKQAIAAKPDKILYKPLDPIKLATILDYYGRLFKGVDPPYTE